MNERKRLIEGLPYLAVVMAIAGLYAWGFFGLLVPNLPVEGEVPLSYGAATPTATPSPVATGMPVDGVYLGEDGSAYCFDGEELLGAVPTPGDCETVFQVRADWDSVMGIEGDTWYYYLPAVFPNDDEGGWDCYFVGELAVVDDLDACLDHAEAVTVEWGYETPMFVLTLPTLLRPVADGFPCYVGRDLVGFSPDPVSCDRVYGENLTSTPYRV